MNYKQLFARLAFQGLLAECFARNVSHEVDASGECVIVRIGNAQLFVWVSFYRGAPDGVVIEADGAEIRSADREDLQEMYWAAESCFRAAGAPELSLLGQPEAVAA
jgi:hypothetical protein